jgi:hypothetical protein
VSAQTAWRALVLVLIVGLCTLQYRQYRALERMADSMADVPANSLVTQWKSGGEVVKVVTERDIGETDGALLVRHTLAVQKKLVDFPIDT